MIKRAIIGSPHIFVIIGGREKNRFLTFGTAKKEKAGKSQLDNYSYNLLTIFCSDNWIRGPPIRYC